VQARGTLPFGLPIDLEFESRKIVKIVGLGK
jgi:hypothetical protein